MNWPIFALAMFFGIVETRYFGWNLFPQSPAEVICDGIVCLLMALALVCRLDVRTSR